MKRLIRSFVLLLALILPYGYYTYSDGVIKYTILHSWPDIWTVVSVEPA